MLFSAVMMTSSILLASSHFIVDLSEQKAYANENGYVLFEGRIFSGKPGHETPESEFTILQKKRFISLTYGLNPIVVQRYPSLQK